MTITFLKRCSYLLLIFLLVQAGCNRSVTTYFYVPPATDTSLFTEKIQHIRELCRNPMNCIPDTNYPDHSSIKYVRVNFHIIRKDDGTGNFSDGEGREYVRKLLERANEKFANNQKMNLPLGNNTPVLPVNIRLQLAPDVDRPDDDGIYFHNHTHLAFSNKKGGPQGLYSSHQMDMLGRRKGEVINVFLLEHPPDSIGSPTYHASIDGVGMNGWIKLISGYREFHLESSLDKRAMRLDIQAGLLNHEVGHILGLMHTWNTHDGCDDTPLNANCWSQSDKPPCDKEYSNNLMDYNTYKNSITPCQIGQMHFNMSRQGSPQRNYIEPTWCQYKPDNPVIIPARHTVVWSCNKDIESNIVIGKHATLIVHCRVVMPEQAKIIVKPGGKLLLNGGVITTDCKAHWRGIEIEKSRKAEGKVEMLNGAKIEGYITPIAP